MSNVIALPDNSDLWERMWARYPRKVSKKAAIQKWRRLSVAQQQEALAALEQHIRYWEAVGTEKQFIPYLSTWLHQERWTDEVELPQPKAAPWHLTEVGTLEHGRKLGLNPRPGEDWQTFKARLFAVRAA